MKDSKKIRMINFAFWTSPISFILAFVSGFITGFFTTLENFTLSYFGLGIGYFCSLFVQVAFLVGFVTIGEVLKNKIMVYSAYISGFIFALIILAKGKNLRLKK
ncbi:MAG: hypothetical protein QW412_01135 [Candidatus Aenigmatarchaeota archaeon]